MNLLRTLPILLFTSWAVAQDASKNVLKLTVMVGGLNGRVPGTGIIFGEDQENLYVITAAHVVGKKGELALVTVHQDLGGHPLPNCSVLASTAKNSDRYERPDPDLGVVACSKAPIGKHRFFYDVLGDPRDLRRGAPLTLIANFSELEGSTPGLKSNGSFGWDMPLGYFLLDGVDQDVIDYFNPLKFDLRGASGGPLLTDRSEIVGLTFVFEGPIETSAKALPWSFVKAWIKNNTAAPIRLATVARSATTLSRSSVELSASVTSVFVPSFGWLSAAPKLRISAPLQTFPHFGVSFDFTFTQSDKNSESRGVTIPSVLAEWQVGRVLGPLRRRELFGGIYLAAGVAPVGLQRTFFDGGRQVSSTRSWTGIFDAGWRYRFPGRSWGLSATYREGAQIGAPPAALYPRFRALDFGTYIVFK